MTIIKKFDTDEVEPKSFSKRYIIFSIIGLLILVIAQIWVSNNTFLYGEKYDYLQQTKDSLTLENQILENEIAKQSSLSSVASESADLGFSKPSSIQYIR